MGWVALRHLLAAENLHKQWQPDKVNHVFGVLL
jgi:hypothetical protein